MSGIHPTFPPLGEPQNYNHQVTPRASTPPVEFPNAIPKVASQPLQGRVSSGYGSYFEIDTERLAFDDGQLNPKS